MDKSICLSISEVLSSLIANSIDRGLYIALHVEQYQSHRWKTKFSCKSRVLVIMGRYAEELTALGNIPKMTNMGGMMQLAVKKAYEEAEEKMPFKVKVAVFSCKMIINYLYSAWALLLLYGIYLRPYAVRPNVDAALAAFDLAPDNMLSYDLAPNVTFFNDHRVWAIRFNHFSARLYFNGTRLSPPDDTFPKFKGRLRRHRTVHPVLRGRASNVSAAVAEEFSWQRAQGWFTVELRLRATLTYIVWPTRHVYYYEFDCWLPFPSNTTPAVISGVKCSKGKRFAFS